MKKIHQEVVDDVLKNSIPKSVGHRIPWLFIGLVGGLLAAGIINRFETILQKNLILAAFIPLVVYMADAVSAQMESFVIRDTALHPRIQFMRYFFRQFLIVLIIGATISIALFLFSWIFYHQTKIALVVTLGMFIAILSSICTGLFIPFIFEKTNLDPANASVPISTIIQDVLSVIIYFYIASWIL